MFKHHCLKHTKQTKHPFEILVLRPVQAFFTKRPFGYPPGCFLNIRLEICLDPVPYGKRNRIRQRPTSRLMLGQVAGTDTDGNWDNCFFSHKHPIRVIGY
ncbi:MAG: hypothetical protein ACOH2E_03040 [Candidatus Paracaedibacter sp.]